MKCCHLILRDVPENTELGIDLMCWRVGKYFKGIKDIPLGIHFVYYSAVNSDCLSGQRVGFVTNVSEPGFIVKKWQKEEEVPTKPVYPSHSSPTEITAHCMDQTYTLCATLDLILSTVPPEKTTAVDSNLEPTRELLGEFQFAFLNLLLNHSIEGWEQWRRIFQLLANCEKAIVDYPNLYIDFITVIYHQLNNASKPELPNDNSTVELLDIFFSESSSSSTQCKLTERGFLPTMLERLFKNIHSVCISDTISTNNTYPNETNDILKDLFKRAEGFAHSIKRRFKWNVISSSHLSQRCTSDINEIPFEEFDWDGDEAPVVVQL
ncbi:Protein AAR2 like [Schistosoma japonicum]|nr:Protein AAR2 like [Schistosoma japonicum]